MQTELYGAIDIGGTKIAAAVAKRSGVLVRITEPTVMVGDERALPEQAIELLERACTQAGVDPAQVRTVGVASAGPFVQREGKLCVSTPNICGGLSGAEKLPNDWIAIPLEQVLCERFSKVVIENDCVAALAAERTFGAVVDERDCAYVTWSTGIGFGLCVDGRILRGKHGNAGHGGHMLMSEMQDALCGCGNRGDLEALISGGNLGARTGRRTPELFAAAQDGERQAREVVEDAARWFGRALYNLSVLLDTRVFVVGGSVWMHHGVWLLPTVMREIESRMPGLTAGVRIVPAQLGTLVADLGAFSLVLPQEWIGEWQDRQPWRALSS